jgi:DNA-binding response OmpR family regulator
MNSKRRILVVDDNHSVVKLLELVLQKEGYTVLSAFDGLEGYQAACREKPDLILLDVIMPEMDGYEVCRRLQAREDTENIPVIFLTVKGDVDGVTSRQKKWIISQRIQERIEGFQAGAIEFLCKPIVAKEVLKQVKQVLGMGSG